MIGTFYGIGVGPGDPELLTVKAINTLKNVDILITPKTEKKDGSVALSTVKPYLKKNIKIVYQVFPMVKGFETNNTAWEANKGEILTFLKNGENVAFCTIGDPMFYSTYIYILRLLEKESVKIVTIPGITAYTAIGSRMNYPIVEGNEILSIIPATADKTKINHALDACDNAVIMKVYRNHTEIIDLLEEKGMTKNAILVSRAGLPDEKIIHDIHANKNEKLNYLSTILTRRDS